MISRTLVSNVLEAAGRWPDRPALEVGDQALSYSALLDLAASLARPLAVESESSPSTVTAVLGHRSAIAFAGVLAALLRGHGYLPLSPHFPPGRLRNVLEVSGCRELVVDDDGVQALLRVLDGFDRPLLIVAPNEDAAESIRERFPSHRVRAREGGARLGDLHLPDVGPDSMAYLLFTSGSTGKSKGVPVSHGNVVSFLDSVRERYALGPEDRLSQTFELTFDLSVFDMFAAWSAGACLCCPSQERLLRTDEYIRGAGLTSFFAVPSLGAAMDRHGMLRPGAFPSLRLSLFCGEALPVSLAERWRSAAPNARIENVYGPTELTIFCTAYEWSPETGRDRSEDGIVAIGDPLPGMETLVVDEALAPVPDGAPGELLVTGPQRTRGYWQAPEVTAAAHVTPPGREVTYYRTGDRVRRDREDGTLFYLGRLDNQIQVQGHRVELGEVEAALRAVAGTATTAAIGWPESEIGCRGIVAFVAATGTDGTVLRSRLADRLPGYMTPSAVHVLEELPLNTSGKVDRKALRTLLAESERHRARRPAGAPPGSPTEKRVARMWEEILGVDGMGRDDDFFDLGGDSIAAARFINALQHDLDEIFHVTTMFERRTVAEFSAYLKDACPEKVSRVLGETVAAASAEENRPVGSATIRRLRSVLEEQHGSDPTTSAAPPLPESRCPAVFILSAPRSGSTLLRVMMAGHPRLFSPPELELASFATLAERAAALAGPRSWRSEGLTRAVMELRGVDAGEAGALLQRLAAEGLTTRDMYARLHEWSGRIVVDKTTTYALSAATLERTRRMLESARYVHLTRHPAATVRSYTGSRMKEVFGRSYPLSAREQAEAIWVIANRNIRGFLRGTPEARSLGLRYEDLVADPEAAMRRLCRFLEIDFDEGMLHPYEAGRMTDGLHAESRMLGDMRFHEHRDIDAAHALRTIDAEMLGELGPETRALAPRLGYRDVPRVGPASRTSSRNDRIALGATTYPLRKNGRKTPLFLLPDASGNPYSYKSLADALDPDRPLISFEAPDRHWRYDTLSLEEQAEEFLADLQAVQPEGPYLLGGWCMGGALAFEIARRLEARGQTVKSVVLFDTRPPDDWDLKKRRAIRAVTRFLLLRCGGIGRWMVDRVGWADTPLRKVVTCTSEGPASLEELRGLLAMVSGQAFDRETLADLGYHDLYEEILSRLDLDEAFARELTLARLTAPPWLHPLRPWHVWFKHSMEYRLRYRPSGRIRGKLTLLTNDRLPAHRYRGWQAFASRPIDVRTYPIRAVDRGVLVAMMEPENVALYARDLEEILGDE